MSQDTRLEKPWFAVGASYRVVRDIHEALPTTRAGIFVPGLVLVYEECLYGRYDGCIRYYFKLVPPTDGRIVDLYDDQAEPDWELFFERLT